VIGVVGRMGVAGSNLGGGKEVFWSVKRHRGREELVMAQW